MLAHRKTTENVGPHTDAESHHPFNADKMKQGPRYIILATKMRHGTIWSKYALYEQWQLEQHPAQEEYGQDIIKYDNP